MMLSPVPARSLRPYSFAQRHLALVGLLALPAACADDTLESLPSKPLCAQGESYVDGQCLGAPGQIVGRLCNQDTGAWRADVTVRIEVGETVLEAVTDAEGRFSLEEVPAGTHYLELSGPGGYAEELVARVQTGQTTTIGLEQCVVPPGSVRGRVCDETQGLWIAGATVSIDDASSSTTTTDQFGNFVFVGLTAGDYVVTISSPGYEGTRQATVIAGETTDLGPAQCVRNSGGVTGRICGGEGYWLSGARVFVDLGGGTVVETTTDSDGHFTLNGVPDGTHTVQVTKGSFSTSFTATVSDGQVTEMPEPVCIPPTARIAVVTGMWDSAEHVLTGLGHTIRAHYNDSTTPVINDASGNVDVIGGDASSFWIESLLGDPAWLADYDILFINCGVDDSAMQSGAASVGPAITNLQRYIEQGNSVYASDWASEIIRLAFPNRINFLGSDTEFGVARVGVPNGSQAAYVTDPGLAQALARVDLTFNLDLGQWVVLDARNTQPQDLRVLVQANVQIMSGGGLFGGVQSHPNAPLVVRFNYGNGRVLFTSAHNEAQTTQDLRDVLNYIVFEL